MKTIIDELDLLKKTFIIQWNFRRKKINYHLQPSLLKKFVILEIPKNIVNLMWREKHEIGKTIKNNCSATKNFWNPKLCWHKMSYYRTSVKPLVN